MPAAQHVSSGDEPSPTEVAIAGDFQATADTVAQESPASLPQPKAWGHRVIAYLNHEDRPLLRDGLLALVGIMAAVGLASQQAHLDDVRLEQQELLENTRFVRQLSLDPSDKAKPLAFMNLRGAQLQGLELGCSDHESRKGCANLDEANLEGADLRNTVLAGAVLTRVALTDADLRSTDLSYADIRETDLSKSKLHRVVLRDADLSMVNLRAAGLSEADLSSATLRFSNLAGADLTHALLTNATLEDTDLTGANLTEAVLTGVDLTGADLTGVNLTGADLTGVNLTGVDLTEADLTGVDLTVALVSSVCYNDATVWPAGLTPPPPSCVR